jgi:hypothetical protein
MSEPIVTITLLGSRNNLAEYKPYVTLLKQNKFVVRQYNNIDEAKKHPADFLVVLGEKSQFCDLLIVWPTPPPVIWIDLFSSCQPHGVIRIKPKGPNDLLAQIKNIVKSQLDPVIQ